MASAHSVAVLVISCDAYRDLWRPFFQLFWKHWPDCPYPVYLGSEVQTYSDARVQMLNVGACLDWSTACARMLERIEQPTTLVMLEDYLLYHRVHTALIEELAEYLRTHNGACLRLFPCPGPDEPCADHTKVGLIRSGVPFRLSLQAALWNTSVLRGLLSPGEDPWQFEANGSSRSSQVPQPFFSVEQAHSPMRYFCTGVRRGLWLRDAVRLCRAQGVSVDLHTRKREAIQAYICRVLRFRLEGCRIAACRAQSPEACLRNPANGIMRPLDLMQEDG